MDKIEKYIDELLEKSTPDRPIWNIEKILQGKKSTWNYIDGCMIKAILEMYAITKDEKYFSFADHFIDCKVMEDGSIEGYSVEELNIDNVNAGKTLFELYDLTGKEKYRKAIDLVYSQIQKMPRTKEGNFWHKNIYPNQVWLDGLYMCQPARPPVLLYGLSTGRITSGFLFTAFAIFSPTVFPVTVMQSVFNNPMSASSFITA